MMYLALLRGINVGGKNKVEMSRLRAIFENLGLTEVRSFLNTGNVVFGDDRRDPAELTTLLETAIADEFGFFIKVLLLGDEAVKAVAGAIPPEWKDDDTMRCYVMFLWGDVDQPSVLDRLTIKEYDDVIYVPGAIIWRVDRVFLTRSGMSKIIGSDLYQSMTIRSRNTVRKLAALIG